MEAQQAARSVEELATVLRAVVLVGLDHATPVTVRALLGLGCVRDRARDTSDDGLTAAARDVIRDALAALGDGHYGKAARLLFGAVDDTRGQPARERRRLAAYQLDILPRWFRRRYEPQIVADVATEVLNIEHTQPEDQPAAPPGAGTGTAVAPTHDDSTSTAVGPVEGGQSRSRRRHVLTRVRHLWHTPDGDQGPVALASGPRVLPVATNPGQLQGVLRGLRDQQTRKEWHRVWLVGGALVFLVYGLDAVYRYLLAVAVLAAGKTTTDVIRDWRATRSLPPGEHWPRLLLRICVVVVVAGLIVGQDDYHDGGSVGGVNDCVLNPDVECPSPDPTADPLPSPYYTPTTYADPPQRATEPECPPAGNDERRLAFNNVPPLCINPDHRYAATIRTNYGHFTVNLNTQNARYTVNNFVYLARWHYYDGVQLIPSPRPAEPTPLPTEVWTHLLSGHPLHPVIPTTAAGEENDRPTTSDDRGTRDSPTTSTTTDPGEVGVPGYTLTFETHDGAYPDDQTLYLVMVNNWQPDQFAIIVTPQARAELADGHGAYPLLGVIEPECRDVIAQRDPTGGWDVSPKSETIIIEAIDITEEPGTTPSTRPTTPTPNTDPCGKLAAARDN